MKGHGSPIEPLWMRSSVALYQRLLLLYPPAFRHAYGAQLVQTFRDQARQAAREHGLPGLLGCWMSMLLDLASNALAEQFTEGLAMSRAALIRLAGGLTLVSVVVLLPLLLGTRTPLFTLGPVFFPSSSGGNGPEVSFAFLSGPSAAFPLVGKVLAACCCAVGLLGVTLTQRRWIGRIAGGLALLGQVGLVLDLVLALFDFLGVLSPDLTVLWLWSLLPLVASLALSLGLIGCSWITFKTGRFPARSVALLVLGLWIGHLGTGVAAVDEPFVLSGGSHLVDVGHPLLLVCANFVSAVGLAGFPAVGTAPTARGTDPSGTRLSTCQASGVRCGSAEHPRAAEPHLSGASH